MTIRAGELTHRLAVQILTQAMNDGGEWVSTWTTVSTVWGKLWAKSGNERQMARANQAEVSHGLLIRPFSGITAAKYRFSMGTRTFAITFVNDTVPGQLTMDLTELPGMEAA